jgi:hypothetical protein
MDAQQWEQDATEKQQKVAALEQEVAKVQQELEERVNSFKVCYRVCLSYPQKRLCWQTPARALVVPAEPAVLAAAHVHATCIVSAGSAVLAGAYVHTTCTRTNRLCAGGCRGGFVPCCRLTLPRQRRMRLSCSRS